MKLMIIVDTSIWIDYFKNKIDVVNIIDNGLNEGSIFITGPIISELLQGVKADKEFRLLSNCINAVPYLDCTYDHWVMAGKTSYELRQMGTTIPLTDIIIASVAICNNACVYTLDKHFEKIKGVELFSC